MPTLSLTLNGANGKPNDWNHVLVPLLQIQAFLNSTGLSSTNIQDNSITWNKIRANTGYEGLRVKVRNNTVAALTADTLVYISGTYNDGTNNYPTVAKAVITSTATTTFFAQGSIEAQIEPSADGTMILLDEWTGKSVANTPVNQPVFLSRTAGGWTTDRPGGSNLVQVIGRVSVASTSGRIIVNTISDQDTLRYSALTLTGLTDNATASVVTLNDTHQVLETRTLIGTSTPTTFGMLVVQEGGMGGIVPSTTGDTLVLGHNREFGMTFASTSTTEAHIYFADPGSDMAGEITYNHATDNLHLNAMTNIGLSIGGTTVATITATQVDILNNSTVFIRQSGTEATPDADGDALVLQSSSVAATEVGMSIISGNAGRSNIFFGDTDDTNIGSIDYRHGNNSMALTVDANAKPSLWMAANGRVGLNTTAASGVLHIKATSGGAGASISANANVLIVDSDSNDTGMTITTKSGGSSHIYFADVTNGATAGQINWSDTNNALSLAVGTTNQLVLDNTGFVGIGGDITPDELLELSWDTDPTILLTLSDTSVALDQEAGGLQWETADGDFGSRAEFKASATTSLSGYRLQMRMATANTSLAPVACFEVNDRWDVLLGKLGGIATATTYGKPHMPAVAGAPTGSPTNSYTGFVPFAYDSTNNRLYVHNSGWKSVALT